MTQPITVSFTLNGGPVQLRVASSQTLLDVLRTELGATEAKLGCGEGTCGTCTVLLDGAPASACLVFAVQADGAAITTVRGLGADGELHPLQASFLEHGAAQCGFCTPGMVLTAQWYLGWHPHATREEIRAALDGNLCRCTGFTKILDAVEAYRDAQEPARGHRHD